MLENFDIPKTLKKARSFGFFFALMSSLSTLYALGAF